MEIPTEFMSVLKAAVRGANCLGCTHQHYLTAAKPKAATNGDAPLPEAQQLDRQVMTV